MDLSGIAQAVGAIGGLGTGIAQDVINYDIGMKNFNFQQQQLDYMKSAQQTTWAREDDAVQRRVADLRRAGLSPTLAAGSAASAAAPVNVTAPQRAPVNLSSALNNAQIALNTMAQKKNIDVSDSQIALNAQKVAQAKQETAGTALDNLAKAHNNKINFDAGTPTDAHGTWPDIFKSVFGMFNSNGSQYKQASDSIATKATSLWDGYNAFMNNIWNSTAKLPGAVGDFIKKTDPAMNKKNTQGISGALNQWFK